MNLTEWKPPNHVADILESEGICVCVGSGRSGKTALGHLLAAWSPKKVYAMAYPDSAMEHCPDGWESVKPEDVFSLMDCTIIFDDAALFASSRNFNSPWAKAWIQFQTIISHKGITVIIIVQNMQLLDIGTLRSQRMAVLYKYSDINNIKYEREEYRPVALSARQVIDRLRESNPDAHPKTWVYDDQLGKAWRHPLAEHWCLDLSTPYRDYIVEVKQ